MTQGALPKTANYAKLAQQQVVLSGELALQAGQRVAHLDTGEPLQVEMRFDVDEHGRHRIQGSINGAVQAQCQRCLEPAVIGLNIQMRLVLLADEEQATDLPEHLEYWLVPDEALDLVELAEEEVLLAMPAVVYHDDCEMFQGGKTGEAADEAVSAAGVEKENPFSVLKGLKTKVNSEDGNK